MKELQIIKKKGIQKIWNEKGRAEKEPKTKTDRKSRLNSF
jgi:hypothetical protein